METALPTTSLTYLFRIRATGATSGQPRPGHRRMQLRTPRREVLFTIDTDSWGYELDGVTDPDGASTTYNGFASNSILTVTIASAAAGDWNVDSDSYGDGGTSVVVTYGSYAAGEERLEMMIPSTSRYGRTSTTTTTMTDSPMQMRTPAERTP